VRRRSAATSSAAPRAQAAAPSQAAAPAAGSGVLRLNSRPWSEVSIDGRPIGNTPLMNVTLSAGSHRVVLRNPQFGLEKSLKITIAAGQVVTRVIELQ
jgi:serine/threonine-protein kinase